MDDTWTPIYFDEKSNMIVVFLTPSGTLVRMSSMTYPQIRTRDELEEAPPGALHVISTSNLEELTGYGS